MLGIPVGTKIRRLFLDAKPYYSIPEIGFLFNVDQSRLEEWIEVGELESVEGSSSILLPWSEVASFAMEFWSQEMVEEALGNDVTAVIPELLRLSDLEVRLPRMQVLTLERLAELDGEPVSAVLARELRDLVSVHAEWLSAEVPGFTEALTWPMA